MWYGLVPPAPHLCVCDLLNSTLHRPEPEPYRRLPFRHGAEASGAGVGTGDAAVPAEEAVVAAAQARGEGGGSAGSAESCIEANGVMS